MGDNKTDLSYYDIYMLKDHGPRSGPVWYAIAGVIIMVLMANWFIGNSAKSMPEHTKQMMEECCR
jgi:hypothetical protein